MMRSVNYRRSRGIAGVASPFSFDFLLLRASRRVPLLTARVASAEQASEAKRELCEARTCAASVARTTRRLALSSNRSTHAPDTPMVASRKRQSQTRWAPSAGGVLILISLLACGCVSGGDSPSSLARIDRLDTIVEGLGTHVDTVRNQLDDKIEEQSDGGVALLGWIAAALFYPVVWRTLRKRQEQNRLEHAGVSQEMMGLSALGVATCQKMAKERKSKPRRKLTRETMPHEPPRSLRKGKR